MILSKKMSILLKFITALWKENFVVLVKYFMLSKSLFLFRMISINDSFMDNQVLYYCENCYKDLFNS